MLLLQAVQGSLGSLAAPRRVGFTPRRHVGFTPRRYPLVCIQRRTRRMYRGIGGEEARTATTRVPRRVPGRSPQGPRRKGLLNSTSNVTLRLPTDCIS